MTKTSLVSRHCVPCKGGTPPLSLNQTNSLLKSVPKWSAMGNQQIDREFEFKNFVAATGFITQVALIAQRENHHPDIYLHQWNKIKITLTTHAIGGLSENDFILAAKIDQLT